MTLDELNNTAKILVEGLEINIHHLIKQYNENSNNDYLIDDTKLMNDIQELKSKFRFYKI
jgi:hypothetical protein